MSEAVGAGGEVPNRRLDSAQPNLRKMLSNVPLSAPIVGPVVKNTEKTLTKLSPCK